MNKPNRTINIWTIAAALGVALTLCIVTGIYLTFRSNSRTDVLPAPVQLTVIPAPTATPLTPPTATLDPAFLPTATPAPGEIAISVYVQIAGTDGEGLRIRDVPGLVSTPLFLGYDSEVFIVNGGPELVDGYTWWYLVAPYDETRAGWAAGDFLEVIPGP